MVQEHGQHFGVCAPHGRVLLSKSSSDMGTSDHAFSMFPPFEAIRHDFAAVAVISRAVVALHSAAFK
jgi:hypothetical protein